MALLWEPGLRVWLTHKGQLLPAVVTNTTSSNVSFTSDYGDASNVTYARTDLNSDLVMAMHHTSVDSVADMAILGDLHEGAILYNIMQRYLSDKIYTYIGSILVAVNPYKRIEGIYGKEYIDQYVDRQLGELPPSIYAIANEVYVSMWRMRHNQCVLISGESGAGKTESTKFMLGYLSSMSQKTQAGGTSKSSFKVETAILESSPILEAFGNAKTVYNNNSSRFGKFIRLNFSEGGNIEGGKIIDYLLEKNRVVRQNPQERNYHIFYGLLAGTTPAERESLQLKAPESYYYLSQSGCISDPTINDIEDFESVRNAFAVMDLVQEQVQEVMSVLSAILHLGNLKFVSAAGAQISNQATLETVATLLSLDSYRLGDAITKKFMVLRGEEITTPLTVEQAADSRDSTSMRIYANLFRWILERINTRIKGGEDKFAFVGVLDIFGFENFTVNRFEQFNINFANEKLQEFFNKHIFSLEQHEYSKEGIDWADIEWVDNAECLNLVEKKLGVLDLLDEESRFPKGTDQSLLVKLHGALHQNSYYIKPKVNNAKFGIRHYAGDVYYEVNGLLEKNRDAFRDDVLKVLKESSSDFVYDLFEHMNADSGGGGGGIMSRQPTALGKRGGKPSRKKATVSSQFKDSLHSLMATLGSANPYFVRCIKPNTAKRPDQFDHQVVLNQLKYSGMMETVRIRRSGYPVRRLFEDFMFRYGVLGRQLAPTLGEKDKCAAIAKEHDTSTGSRDWQIGKTKMFYRENLERLLEKQRDIELREVCRLIYRVILTVVTRRKFLKAKARIVQVQKLVRAFIYRRRFLRIKKATICMQKYERARQARKLFAELLEQKRIEEERRREEERRKEEERLRELQRLEREKKEAEAAEMRRQHEEEEKRKKLVEEARLKAEEEMRLAAMQKIRELEEEHRRLEEERRRLEEEARIEAELEAARIKAEKELAEKEKEAHSEARFQREAQDAFAIIGDLDNALKAFQGALGLSESDTDVESDTEEDEYESESESVELLMEDRQMRRSRGESEGTAEEEMFDPHSAKFRAEGQLMSYEEEPSFEGYLQVRGTTRLGWKRRWAIIKDDVLLFFEMKQDAIKQGWLDKKSSGSGTLGRRNWRPRYFALRGKTLFYYADSDLANARPNGAIDLNDVSGIIEDGGSREHVFGVVTPERTYHLTAPDANEKREWCEIIRRVRSMPEAKVKSLLAHEVDPRNALLSIDIEIIDSVAALDQEKKPNGFALYTSSRIHDFVSDSPAEMHMWIAALSPKKFSLGDDDVVTSCLAKGWLIKEGRIRRKRYFVLTESFQLRYYKSEDTRQPVAGNIHLNCLCAVDPWTENDVKETGVYTFKLHARKSTYALSARTVDDANEWMLALQDAIDSTLTVQTITERLVLEIIKSRRPDWDKIYIKSKALCRTSNPIKAPLLALPYGKPPLSKEKDEMYGTRHQEAVKIFNALLAQDSLADPIKQVQEVVQKCFDMQDLQSEVFCQLIKQTAGINEDDIDTPGVLSCWQTLACMCCTFIPERAIKRYLVMHIKKIIEKYPDTEMGRFAVYCQTSLQRTKRRDFVPSRNEVIACLGRRDLNATVYCYGGGQCTININPSTNAGEVVQKLSLGLQISGDNNLFALFEVCGGVSKVIDDRTILVDILGKFEMNYLESMRNIKQGIIPEKRKLFFKLFCFISPQNVPTDSIENAFMFEQFCDDVIAGRFPASQERLMKLAALRMQFLEGDFKTGATIDDVSELFPVSKIEMEVRAQKDSIYGSGNFHDTYYQKTLRDSKGVGTLSKKFKAPQITEEDKVTASVEVQKNTVKTSIVELWKRLQGVTNSQAQQKYMEILSECPGFASTVFEAEYVNKDQRFPQKLWLAINNKGVQIYQRGAVAPINSFSYETVVSFGAPAPNEYRLVVEGLVPISLQTSMVAEIAKLMTAYIRLVVVRMR